MEGQLFCREYMFIPWLHLENPTPFSVGLWEKLIQKYATIAEMRQSFQLSVSGSSFNYVHLIPVPAGLIFYYNFYSP